MTSPRKKCAFCQRDDRKITNEHVWPDWIRNCLPPGFKQLHVQMHRAKNEVRHWSPKDSTGVTVNDICKPCNEGWMHVLEESVREPFLCEMIKRGASVALNEKQVTTLATWAYKIVLVFNLVGPSELRCFTQAHYDALYADPSKPPLSGLVIWLASYDGSMLSTATDRGLTFSDHGGEVIVATYSVGRFAFQALLYDPNGLPSPGVWIPHIPPEYADKLVLLWPIVAVPGQGYSFWWPPSTVLDDAGMIALRNRWDRTSFNVDGILLS